jgi:hypothetical protein
MSSLLGPNLKSKKMKTRLTFLLAAGLLLGAVSTTQAQSRYDNGRDIRHDRVDVRHDRQDMRYDRNNMSRDKMEGNRYAVRHDRRDMIHDRRDLRYDRHDLNRDRCY